MQFDNFSDFIAMGGYGFYVWLSFGISAALLSALVFSSLRGHKLVIKNIAIRQQRERKLSQLRKQRADHNEKSHNTTNEVNQ